MSEEAGKVLVPAKAGKMLIAAHEASQAAQREFVTMLEMVRATLDVPADWQARQMEDGQVWFVGVGGETGDANG